MNLDVKKLFEEPSLIQITTWARGVIEIRTQGMSFLRC